MLVDIRRTSPLRNGRADWINDESRLATVLRYACLIVRIFATPLYFDEGVNGGYPPIGKALPQNAANHTLDVGLQAMRATIDHAESIGPVTFDSDAIFLHGLLFFDRPSDQRRFLPQPFQREFAILVHPVPFTRLANNALIVLQMETVQSVLGLPQDLFRHLIGNAHLQRWQENFEPTIFYFVGVENHIVCGLFALVHPIGSKPIVAPFIGLGSVPRHADEVVHGAHWFEHC
jgi:hypothetical protein